MFSVANESETVKGPKLKQPTVQHVGNAAADLGALLRMPVAHYILIIHIINTATTAEFPLIYISIIF